MPCICGSTEVDPDVVAAERPDIVIHEWAGRRLMNHGTYNAVADERPAASFRSCRA